MPILRSFILATLCFVIHKGPSAIFKLQILLQGICYFLFCHDKPWKEPSDPRILFAPYIETEEGKAKIERKTIFFVLHGESTWNGTFNKGSYRNTFTFALCYFPGVVKGLMYDFYFLLSGKRDSWFYDAPLSNLGIKQVR